MPRSEFLQSRLEQSSSLSSSSLRQDDCEIQNLGLVRHLPPDDESIDFILIFAHQRQYPAPAQQLSDAPLRPLPRLGRPSQNLSARGRLRLPNLPNIARTRIALVFTATPPFSLSGNLL